MTTVIVKDGTITADTRAYSGNADPIGEKSKIFHLSNGGYLVVSASQVGLPNKLRNLVEEHGHQATMPCSVEASALLITEDNEVWYFNDGEAFSGPLEGDHHVIGSGSRYALGALEFGATAEEAIMVASRLDPWTNDSFETIAYDT